MRRRAQGNYPFPAQLRKSGRHCPPTVGGIAWICGRGKSGTGSKQIIVVENIYEL